MNIRRYPVRPARLTDLVATGTLSMAAAEFLDSAAAAGANVIVAGGTQAGKTTILNALLGGLPAAERIISCEEVREIRIEHPDWVALQTRDPGVEGTGAVDLRDLVRESLRMRPSRVVVGEVRGAEALDLLLAMNCGIPCSATLHANSAEDAVAKLCGLPLLAGPNIASGFVTETVMSCVDLVVHVTLQPGGERRVSQICSVLPGAAGPLLGRIFLRRDGELVRGSAEVPASLRQVVTP